MHLTHFSFSSLCFEIKVVCLVPKPKLRSSIELTIVPQSRSTQVGLQNNHLGPALYFMASDLTLKAPITTAADDKLWDIFHNFRQNKVWFSRRFSWNIMPYWLILKSGKIWNCRLLQIIGGALRVKARTCIRELPLVQLRTHVHMAIIMQKRAPAASFPLRFS